jgi:gibberellin A4 carboxyl methyltransferase
MAVTTGMKGEGYYDQHSSPQWAAISAVLPWVEDAVSRIGFSDEPAPIVAADFGCSEGQNSIAAMRRIVAALRARTPRPILTVHSDLPTNNFNQLFINLATGGQAACPEPQVYSAAVGGSMFEQLLPPRTVTVATTFNAVGYLDRRPDVELPDYILPMGPSRPRPGVGVADAARRAFADQAGRDLVCFYRARAEEIIPGGKLLVASFGVDGPHRCCDGLYDVLSDALLDLVAAGRLDRAAYERLVLPVYFRTKEELVDPVLRPDSPVAGLFRLERADGMEVPVPFNRRRQETGDLAAYAAEFTGFLRAFSEPILRLTFPDQNELDALIDEVYRRVQSRLIDDPSAYEFRYIQVAALLTRT